MDRSMTVSQYLGFCPSDCVGCADDLTTGKAQPITSAFVVNYEHAKSVPGLDYVTDTIDESAREVTKDHVDKQVEQLKSVIAQLREIVQCSSPDGSKELEQVRLMQRYIKELETERERMLDE